MPTYEYRCKECGHEFEAQQAFTDDALTECPSCGGRLRKVFGNVGITFKGSGFYKNDSRSGSSSSSSGDSGKVDAGSKGDSGSSGDSSSKPDSGAPAKSESSPKPDSAKPASTSA